MKKNLLRTLCILALSVLPAAAAVNTSAFAAEIIDTPEEIDLTNGRDETVIQEETSLQEEDSLQEETALQEETSLLEETALQEETVPAEEEEAVLPEEADLSAEKVEYTAPAETETAAANETEAGTAADVEIDIQAETETGIPVEAETEPVSEEKLLSNAAGAILQENRISVQLYDRIHYISLNDDYAASDSILIESDGHYGLIDASHPSSDPDPSISDYTVDVDDVINYLQTVGVMHLDFVLGTHSHSDHIGGMKFLASALNTEGNYWIDSNTVYYYKQYHYNTVEEGEWGWQNSRMFRQSVEAMAARGAILVETSVHDSAQLEKANAVFVQGGDDPVSDSIEFLLGNFSVSLFNLYHNSSVNENLNSIVTAVRKDDRTTLLMGDLEMEGGYERRAANAVAEKYENADVIKLGHHGYEECTGSDMLRTLEPSYVVTTSNRTGNFYDDEPPYNYFLSNHGITAYRAAEALLALVEDLSGEDICFYTYDRSGELTVTPKEWKGRMAPGWHKWERDDEAYDYIFVFDDGSVAIGWYRLTRKGKTSWYLFDQDGIALRGFQKDGQYTYYFNIKSEMQTGWQLVDGTWYYMDGYGIMQTGWLKDGANWYYLDPENEGAMAKKRFVSDENGMHYVDGYGIMQVNRILQIDGKSYYANGYGIIQHESWFQTGGKWYYADADGTLLKGIGEVENTKYLFDTDTGAMIINQWYQTGGGWYHSDGYGRLLSGWQQFDGKWYFMDPDNNGAMARNRFIADENGRHYVDGYGIMQVNKVILIGGKLFAVNGYGIIENSGWCHIAGKWYYADADGVLKTGVQSVENTDYLFDTATGAMKINQWYQAGGAWYHSDGYGRVMTGWQQFDGNWYYMDPEKGGTMSKGRFVENFDGMHYVDGYGIMQKGRVITAGGKMYYLNSAGVLALNQRVYYGGVYYNADSSGVLTRM